MEIKVGDSVYLSVREGTLIVTPLRRIRGGHDLRELVARIPKEYLAEKVDWGNPLFPPLAKGDEGGLEEPGVRMEALVLPSLGTMNESGFNRLFTKEVTRDQQG